MDSMSNYREAAAGVGEVDRAFRGTVYAEYLRDSPRWTKYQPEHIDDVSWRAILHADANSLDHSRLMIGYANYCMQRDPDLFQLSSEELTIVYKAIAMQDWSKSFDDDQSSGGDKAYDDITLDDIENRRRKFHIVYDELVPDSDVKEKFLIESAIFNPESRLGSIFDSIRRLGYLRVALIAYNQAQNFPDDPVLTRNLNMLAADTASNQLIPLLGYAEEYPAVKAVLEELTTQVNALVDENEGPHKTSMAMGQRAREAFERAKELWERSTFVLTPERMTSPDYRKYNPTEGIMSYASAFRDRYIDDKETLRALIEQLREREVPIVLTSGSFDLIHIGHARYIERASEFGFLVVGVDSDAKIQERKGPTRPVIGETERLQMLAQLRGVGALTLKHPDEAKWGLIKLVRPDVLVVTAETYSQDEIHILEQEYCGKVVVLEPQATTSTSARIRHLELQAASGASEKTRRMMGTRIIELLKANVDPVTIMNVVHLLMANGDEK